MIYTYRLMVYNWRMFWKICRDTCSNYYGLEPVYDNTWPNFAFDAMLKLGGIEIDLVYNQEMYAMIEAGLRRGMTQTTCKKIQVKKVLNLYKLFF